MWHVAGVLVLIVECIPFKQTSEIQFRSFYIFNAGRSYYFSPWNSSPLKCQNATINVAPDQS